MRLGMDVSAARTGMRAAPALNKTSAAPKSRSLVETENEIGSSHIPMSPYRTRLEIGLRRLRHREQLLIEVIVIALGAHRFKERVRYLPPFLHHVDGLVERIRILDGDQCRQLLAIR